MKNVNIDKVIWENIDDASNMAFNHTTNIYFGIYCEHPYSCVMVGIFRGKQGLSLFASQTLCTANR